MPLVGEQLVKQYERMMADHQLWRPMWQDLSDYILPKRSKFITQRQPGAKQTEKLFDSTAPHACERLASIMNGTLTSRSIKWFTLRMRDSALNEIKEIDEWLEDCSSRMFRAYNQSNFAQEIYEVYHDEAALGTGGMFEEERNPYSSQFEGFVFTAMPLHDFCIEENSEGKVDTVFRTFQWSAAACIRKWGRAKVGEKILKAFDEGKPEKMFTILHAILPRTPTMAKLGSPATKLPWASGYVAMEGKHLINESGFHEFPCMVPRWSKSSGEQYGRGPSFVALPDIKTLNKITEITLKVAAKLLAMPTKSREEGVIGPIRNTEGGNTIVRNMDDIAALFEPGYFREVLSGGQLKSEDLRNSTRMMFYYDQLAPPLGVMTATEFMKRFEVLQRVLGSTMGSQETELLNPLSDRSFGLMYRKGGFLPVPQELLEATDGKIDVQYEGPLAKSQRLAEAEGIEQIAQSVMAIAAVYPDILDTINWEEGIRITADIRGVPSKVLRDPEDVAKIRADRAERQAQQQQLADVGKMADAAGKATPAIQALTGGGNGGSR